MIYATTSLIIALTIAFGRQSAVFGKIKLALWFFTHFETKRVIFSISSLFFGVLAIYIYGLTTSIIIIESLALLFILFAFFFDMKYFFPEVDKVEKTKANNISPQVQIIGVKIGNSSVAYPMKEVVIPRHLINDKINENAILISYCAICQSALAFKARIDQKDLYFKVAGVWRRNMIIHDTETYSLWQQATGECIYGKMKGKQLELLSGENTTFGEWKKKHAETLFASKCVEARKGYLSREFMYKALNIVPRKILMPGYSDLSDLPIRETVFGINYNGVSKAYPKSKIEELHFFTDQFGDKELNLEYNKSSEYLSAKDTLTQDSIIVEKHWWLGWKEFHSETEIWEESKS